MTQAVERYLRIVQNARQTRAPRTAAILWKAAAEAYNALSQDERVAAIAARNQTTTKP